jgi:hypothetical protein
MKCTACGAELGANVPQCTFCGAVTTFGLQQQHAAQHQAAQAHAFQLHREYQRAQQKQFDANRSLKRTADASLYWGIGGLVACCFFIPSAIAMVLGVRARKMARRYDLVIPTNATIGLVLGSVGIGFGLFMIGIVIVQNHERESTLAEIETQLAGKLERATIDQPTACLLAKRSLLKGEFNNSDTPPDDFDCDGALTLDGDSGVLEDVKFTRSSTRFTVRACLKRGARWSVSGFRQNNACSDPDDTSKTSAMGSATGSASETTDTAPTNAPAPSGSSK